MIGEFALIIIRKGSILRTPQEFFNLGKQIVEYINAKPVPLKEFNEAFTAIPRTVVEHSKELKEIHEKIIMGELDAKSVKLNKDLFIKKQDQHVRDISFIKEPDPAYGVLDLHMLETDDGSLNVINISINGMKSVETKAAFLSGLVDHLTIGMERDVISVYSRRDKQRRLIQYEYFKSVSAASNKKIGRTRVRSSATESSALVVYQSLSGIDVGFILQSIDRNVDTQNADNVIAEAIEMENKLAESIKYMTENKLDKASIDAAKKELESVRQTKQYYIKLKKENKLRMVTLPFKMQDPDKINSMIVSGYDDFPDYKENDVEVMLPQ